MRAQQTDDRPQLLGAWLVHFYTATGALAAFFATLAVFNGRYRDAFLFLAAALFIDSTDGFFARAVRVREVLPGFDGARLDNMLDYLNYAFVPMLLLYHAGTLPAGWGGAVASVVLLSSAYQFAAADAKTDDDYFMGFPSYWNVAALYLYAARFTPLVNAIVLLFLSALVFVRVAYVYPSKTAVLRNLTVTLALVWGGLMLAIILMLPDVPGPVLIASLLFPLYYLVLSLILHTRRLGRPASTRQ